MHRFRIDFSMNRGHEMLIDKEEGIFRIGLDDIELNMLRGERIPYLLPVDWFELDGKVTFRYALSGYKMLLHRLQHEPLTMEQFYMLALGLTDALDECRHYMLRPEGCLLDDQFIFVGERLHDVRLAYVPLKAEEGEAAAGAGDLMALLVRWISYVEAVDGEGLKQIFRLLSAGKWPLAELRYKLLDLIGNGGAAASASVRSGDMPGQTAMTANAKAVETHKQPEPRMDLQQKYQPQEPLFQSEGSDAAPRGDVWRPASSSAESDGADEPGDEGGANRNRFRWIRAAAMLLAAACIWRFIYLAAPSRQTLFISAAFTLLLGAALLLIRKRGKTDGNSGRISALDRIEPQSERQPAGEMDGEEQYNRYGKLFAAATGEDEAGPDRSGAFNRAKPDHTSSGETGLLIPPAADRSTSGAEPTVLLAKAAKDQPANMRASLQRKWQGRTETIEWSQASIKIGRAGEQLGYEDPADGISRIHLEFEYGDGVRSAKDLGSRNGSTLNGEAMIPYKAYPIQAGDVVQLAGSKGPSYELIMA